MNEYFEAEYRALVSKEKYYEVLEIMNSKGEDLGVNDTDTYFFILPSKLLKLSNHLNLGYAEISLKSGKISATSFLKEKKVTVSQKDFKTALSLLKDLNLTNSIMYSSQKKHAFRYYLATINLKYSESWGYHIEVDIPLETESDKDEAYQKAKKIEKEFGIQFMTQDELMDFTKSLERKTQTIA